MLTVVQVVASKINYILVSGFNKTLFPVKVAF